MQSTTITTPDTIYYSGAIINRDGETISDIREKRGVMFAIPKIPDKKEPSQRTIKITGTPDGLVTVVADIRQLIDACICRHYYFDEPLVTALSIKEKLGIKNPVPTNAREAYGLDIYQARHLCSIFSIESFKDLWLLYRDLNNNVKEIQIFEDKIIQAIVGSSFKSKLILFLLKNTINEPILDLGLLSRFRKKDDKKLKKGKKKKQQVKKDNSDSDIDDGGEDSDDLFGANDDDDDNSDDSSDDGGGRSGNIQISININNNNRSSRNKEQKNDNPLGGMMGGLLASMEDDANAMASGDIVDMSSPPKVIIKPKKQKLSPILQPIENEASCVKKYRRACGTLYLLPKNTIIHNLQNEANTDMTEYRLGSAGATAFAEGLKHRTCRIEILSVCGCDIDDTGGAAIGEVTTKTARLRSLNLSKNKLGHRTAVALSRGFRLKDGLTTLNLGNTGIGNAFLPLFARAIKKTKSNITNLDISKCKMNNKGCKALCIALAACPKIQALNVSWNNIGARSMYRLGDAISNSTTIQKLDLSYNSLNDEGGVVFGAFLACCKSLIHINCTENRLGPNSAYAIADGIRYCRTMRTLDISNNPLGENGVLELLDARRTSKLYFLGLKGTDSTGGPQANEDMFLKPMNESYMYEMNLNTPKNRAYAQLLRLRAAEGNGRWASAKLNRAVLVYRPRKNKKWNVPRDGLLEIDYRAGRQKPVNLKHGEEKFASVHFKLNLRIRAEYEMAKRLLNLAVIEVGENWKNETFQGEPFEFDEQVHTAAWLPRAGILEFDYVSPSFKYITPYKFNLNKKKENAEATRLATLVYRSKIWNPPRFRDQWANMQIDGEGKDLRMYETRISKKINRKRVVIGNHTMTQIEKHFHLPNSGVLTFDYTVKDPTYFYSNFCEFDLTIPVERHEAITLFHQANRNPGEMWWGPLIDGKIARLVNIEGKPYIPKKGYLQFDYLYYLPSTVLNRMYRQTYVMDMNDKRQYTMAQTFHAQFVDNGRYDNILSIKHRNVGDFILNAGDSIVVMGGEDMNQNGNKVPPQMEGSDTFDEKNKSATNDDDDDDDDDNNNTRDIIIPSNNNNNNNNNGFDIIDPQKAHTLEWKVPKTGMLEIETIYFRKRPLLTDREFKSFLQEVRCQNSEMLKLEMLHMSCQGKFYLSVAMIGTLAKEFETIQGQRDCVTIILRNLSELQFQNDLYKILENSKPEVDLWIDIVELGKLGKKDGKDCEVL